MSVVMEEPAGGMAYSQKVVGDFGKALAGFQGVYPLWDRVAGQSLSRLLLNHGLIDSSAHTGAPSARRTSTKNALVRNGIGCSAILSVYFLIGYLGFSYVVDGGFGLHGFQAVSTLVDCFDAEAVFPGSGPIDAAGGSCGYLRFGY